MPKGPQGQKRPADVIGCAVMIAKIATGDLEETLEDPAPTIKRAQTGGHARAAKLTKSRRKEIAQKAASARWTSNKS
jgi:hypothetical protein